MHYYQFHIGDYQSDTRHLELMEDLAYRRMLDLYYKTENPLPTDVEEIARLIGMRSHSDCIEIVLKDFFERTDEGWKNNKADEVLSATYSKSEKARRSAKARWAKKDEEKQQDNANALRTDSEGNANGMLPITHYPIPNTQVKDGTPPAKPDDAQPIGKAKAIQMMELFNDTKQRTGANWLKISDPAMTSEVRYKAAIGRAKFAQQRLGSKGKPNDWPAVLKWFGYLYDAWAADPFYSGHQASAKYPEGYKRSFESLHAEKAFIEALDRMVDDD